MLKVSFSRKLSRTNFSASLACSIFLPLMLPDRSTTKMTVFAGRSSVLALI